MTGNATYLDKAVQIHHNLTGVWNAWNATCGGLNWNATGGYVNSITNELFLVRRRKGEGRSLCVVGGGSRALSRPAARPQ